MNKGQTTYFKVPNIFFACLLYYVSPQFWPRSKGTLNQIPFNSSVSTKDLCQLSLSFRYFHAKLIINEFLKLFKRKLTASEKCWDIPNFIRRVIIKKVFIKRLKFMHIKSVAKKLINNFRNQNVSTWSKNKTYKS